MAGTDLNKLDAMTDADIDYSDIPELSDDFAEQAEWFSGTGKLRRERQGENETTRGCVDCDHSL